MDSQSEQFSQIYDLFIEKIYRFVYLKVSSREMAEDITSKVFLKGWEAFQKQGNKIENPGAFLYQVARNSVIDHYRSKGRTQVVSMESLGQVSGDRTETMDKVLINADMDVIKSAIRKLKPDQQDLIIWYYLDDMAVGDISKILKKPEGAVRVAIHRALNELRNLFPDGRMM